MERGLGGEDPVFVELLIRNQAAIKRKLDSVLKERRGRDLEEEG